MVIAPCALTALHTDHPLVRWRFDTMYFHGCVVCRTKVQACRTSFDACDVTYRRVGRQLK